MSSKLAKLWILSTFHSYCLTHFESQFKPKLNKQIMYRNTYLQLYKTASKNDSTLTVLLAHFAQIYNTLGCVLQDLEFQIGKSQAQPRLDSNHRSRHQNEKTNQSGKVRQESGSSYRSARKEVERMRSEVKLVQPQQSNVQLPKKAHISLESQSNWISKMVEQPKLRPFQPKATQIPRSTNPKPNVSSNSFEDLFTKKSLKMELEPHNRLAAIPQLPESSHFGGQNSFDDFFDRFFKESGSSTKSR